MRVVQICGWHTFLLGLLLCSRVVHVWSCSSGCTCTTVPATSPDPTADGADEPDDELALAQPTKGRKVNCSNNPYQFTSIEAFSQDIGIPLDTIYLDLSKNEITVLRKGSFSEWSDLQRLDLSNNQISLIEPGAFQGLNQLDRLDLSHNKLGSINGSIFAGLNNLKKLVLSFNKLNTIPDGTFNDLTQLRRLDFQSDYLRCDCHLQWMIKWARDKKVKIKATTICAVPRELKDQPLKKLKRKDLHCDRPLELPLFEISPGVDQIVFEGDKIPFVCQAAIVHPHTEMYWLREGGVVETNRSRGIFTHTRTSPDNTIMMHSLVLEDLKSANSGQWQCLVATPQGNVTKNVDLVVIDSNAQQCERNTTKTNKGVYIWKETIAGVTKEQPCKMGEGVVTHMCDRNGRWKNFNSTACDFINERTRTLESLGNASNSSKIMSDAKTLVKLVSSSGDEDPLSTISPQYVDLVSLAIYRLSQHAGLGDKIVNSVLFSASKMMNISGGTLVEAQKQRKSLSRIVNAVESIPSQMSDKSKYSQSSQLIVMEARTYPRQQFPGLQCHRWDLKADRTLSRMVQTPSGFVFVCSEPDNSTEQQAVTKTVRGTDSLPAQALATQAHKNEKLTSILIPRSILQPVVVEGDSNVTTTTSRPLQGKIHLQFIWYGNANLFQTTAGRHDDRVLKGKTWRVISPVLSISLSEPVTNLTEPITLVFEIPSTNSELVPAYWDDTANGGYGDWRTDGCKIINRGTITVTVTCQHLTAFAILEGEGVVYASMFQMMEIVVYIGSCICLLCLMAVIITYVSCFRFLNVPRKMKHSVINISASVLLLIIGFTMGVKRTDHVKACQVVGVILHYLSMVVMFWFTVTASNMMKKFRKTEKPPAPPPDFPMPLPPKPIIRFYLLAWGVPCIVCGITAAISFDFYNEPGYCFLEWQPGLGAFLGPVVFLLLLTVVFILRCLCIVKSSTGPLLTLEETHELPVTDIELTAATQDRMETASMMSAMTGKTSISSVMDFERKPITQLRALAICLVLFIFTWIFGAITVAKPFSVIPHQEIIFSYLYGIFCAILGLFMLIYFCLTRQDSRSSWKRFFLCEAQTPVFTADVEPEEPEPRSNGHVSTGSGMDMSKVSSTVISNHVTPPVKKSDDEMSSINLVPSKPPSIIDSSLNNSANEVSAASFYNPRQNGIAKKFWEKKNKHNSKLLSKEMTKSLNMNGTDSDFSGSERPRGAGQGYNSDGNSGCPGRLTVEMPAQRMGEERASSQPRSPCQPSSPPSYTTVISPHYPGLVNTGPQYLPQAAPHGGHDHRVASPGLHTATNPQQHSRNNSSSSLGVRNHTSAFSVVPPRNNTLPKQGKLVSHSNPSSPEREIPDQTFSVPSSVARTGDFDGSSQVSSAYSHEHARSPRPGDLQYYSSQPNRAMYKQYGLIDGQPVVVPLSPGHSHRHRTNSGGYSSGGESRHRRQLENSFLAAVEQRIPLDSGGPASQPVSPQLSVPQTVPHNGVQHVPHKPPISPASDSDYNGSRVTFPDSDSQLHCKKQVRYNDSDHNSEPASQSHRVGRDSHKHSKPRGLTKQRSLDWDKQFKDKPPPGTHMAPYAYVNHNYNDRVLQKLTTLAITEQIDPQSKAFWVPRSSRSYNQLVMREHAHLCEDSSTSSSEDDDDSLDNIWVPLKHKKSSKNKKETSV